MDGKHVILIILMMKRSLPTIYYSRTEQHYNDSVSLCENEGGQLLRYGEKFLTGFRACENSTRVSIWTGHPHYTKLGCSNINGDKQSEMIVDNHFAKCADFCDAGVYSYVGITNNKCACYWEQPNIKACGRSVKCPGNSQEACGQNNEPIVYEKEYNTSCRFRYYTNTDNTGSPNKFDANSCENYLGKFFCRVGTSTEINCDYDSITTTVQGELTRSTQEPPTSATTKGLIIGLAVAAAVLLTIIIIIICQRVRTKSSDSGGTKHEKIVAYQTNSSQESDKDNTSVKTGENQQSLMYDSASLRNNTTSNNGPDNTYSSTTIDVYDSAAQGQGRTQKNKPNNIEQEYGCVTKSEGVYDSAVQNQSETKQLTRKDDLHVYDYRGITEGLYDSASNQQVVQKPHTEENEYGCTVKPEGLYDVSGTQSQMTSSLPADNIYDHNGDILYDLSTNKSGTVVTDIYDHT